MTGKIHIDVAQMESARRIPAWVDAVSTFWPGLQVQMGDLNMETGSIDFVDLGSAELFTVVSAPAEVVYSPGQERETRWTHVSLMVQSLGSSQIQQAERKTTLGKGDMCLLDERERFTMKTEEPGEILFLRLPRAPTISLHPHLEKLFARTLHSEETGTRLLSDTLLRLSEVADVLSVQQRAAMASAVVQMLGIAEPLAGLPDNSGWRIRRAVDFIENNLSVPGLRAEDVAKDQSISRRRLDQLMQEAYGVSIAARLWGRRIEQASLDLRDPRKAEISIAQIAFSNGFEDAAHFTRAFRRRFGLTPGQWRLN